MLKLYPKAFTLVELIVVITILAILGTIAFISLQGYSANARDSVRISNLTNMNKGLAFIQAKDGKLPDPVGLTTTITSSGTTLMTQGEINKTMAEQLLKMSGDITDPVDQSNPIYSLTLDKKYFQVALFLEAESLAISNTTHAADGKTIITKGDKLGIILDSTETPVNQQSTHQATVELNTTSNYIAYLNDDEKIEASGTALAEQLTLEVQKLGSLAGSCKDLLKKGFQNIDGEYTIYINQEPLQVYCDMTTDGGGWTRYVEIKGNYPHLDAVSCVNGNNLDTPELSCMNPHDILVKSAFMYIDKTTNIHYKAALDNVYNHSTSGYVSHYNRTIYDRMGGSIYVRLGLSYTHVHSECGGGRHPGGSYSGGDGLYMNYDTGGGCSGPVPGTRNANARLGEFYVR